jgi:16S rRNA (cytidine1402-2'-O)-methyltransferase
MVKTLYLIPCHLAEDGKSDAFALANLEVIRHTKYYFVENVRSARRFISSLKLGITIDELTFFELDKNTENQLIKEKILEIPAQVEQVGVLSEAGCPGVADPGAKLVAIAHQLGWKVAPLVGPSSILLGLMASGFNGQRFFFHGYLPIKQEERIKAIRKLEEEAITKGITQLFIETPFRNQSLFQDLLQTLRPNTLLCIASNLTSSNEFVSTKKVVDWKNNIPNINKIPTIFLIGQFDLV